MTEHVRTDIDTAEKVREALAMQRAFGRAAALDFLRKRAVPDELALAALAGRYERRAQPNYSSSSSSPGS